MFLGRFLVIVPVLAIAGSLAAKQSRPHLLAPCQAWGSRAGAREGILLLKTALRLKQLKRYCPVEVADVVDAELSSLALEEEEAIEVEVAVLVAEAIGVVEATDATAVLDAEVVADASGVLEALVEVSGRGEVVEAMSAAAR
jgi:hypothetical protein